MEFLNESLARLNTADCHSGDSDGRIDDNFGQCRNDILRKRR